MSGIAEKGPSEEQLARLREKVGQVLPPQPSSTWFAGRLNRWMCKKALLLDVSEPVNAEYLRAELLELHAKYHVTLDSKVYDLSLRLWERDLKRYMEKLQASRKGKNLPPTFAETMEKVSYIAFLSDFARHYWSNGLIGRLMRRVDK